MPPPSGPNDDGDGLPSSSTASSAAMASAARAASAAVAAAAAACVAVRPLPRPPLPRRPQARRPTSLQGGDKRGWHGHPTQQRIPRAIPPGEATPTGSATPPPAVEASTRDAFARTIDSFFSSSSGARRPSASSRHIASNASNASPPSSASKSSAVEAFGRAEQGRSEHRTDESPTVAAATICCLHARHEAPTPESRLRWRRERRRAAHGRRCWRQLRAYLYTRGLGARMGGRRTWRVCCRTLLRPPLVRRAAVAAARFFAGPAASEPLRLVVLPPVGPAVEGPLAP